MPVVTLGFGAALTHLLRQRPGADYVNFARAGQPGPGAAAAALANGHAAPRGRPWGGGPAVRRRAGGRGEVPSVRRIRREMSVGQPRAQEVRSYLAALTVPDRVPAPGRPTRQTRGQLPYRRNPACQPNQPENHPDAEVIPLRAVEAHAETGLDEARPPAPRHHQAATPASGCPDHPRALAP